MRITYVYDSGLSSSSRHQDILDKLSKLQKKAEVEIVDTAKWSDDIKLKFYLDKLMPISIVKRKRLRGRVRTHKSGTIFYRDLVVIDDEDFYFGNEAIEKLIYLAKRGVSR